MDKNMAELRPGTAPARAQGCTCQYQPVGRHTGYAITPGCPLHDVPEIVEQGQEPWNEVTNMHEDTPHNEI